MWNLNLYKAASEGYYQFAVIVVMMYVFVSMVSMIAHRKKRCTELIVRSSSVIKEAARYAMRSKEALDRADKTIHPYLDALKAKVYVESVKEIVGSDAVSEIMSINLDMFLVVINEILERAQKNIPNF